MVSKKKTSKLSTDLSKPPVAKPAVESKPAAPPFQMKKPPGPRKMPEELDPGLYRRLGLGAEPTVIQFRKGLMRQLAIGTAPSIELFHRANAELQAHGISITLEESRLASAK